MSELCSPRRLRQFEPAAQEAERMVALAEAPGESNPQDETVYAARFNLVVIQLHIGHLRNEKIDEQLRQLSLDDRVVAR